MVRGRQTGGQGEDTSSVGLVVKGPKALGKRDFKEAAARLCPSLAV